MSRRGAGLKNPIVIATAAVLAIVAFVAYRMVTPPAGVEIKGPEETIAWLSLATAVVSLLTSIAGIVLKVVELRGTASASAREG